MPSPVPPISKPNYVAIAGMQPADLLKVREAYIVLLVSAYRRKDSDCMTLAIEWIDALVAEMRMRGAPVQAGQALPGIPQAILEST